jgi:hypothetical protein
VVTEPGAEVAPEAGSGRTAPEVRAVTEAGLETVPVVAESPNWTQPAPPAGVGLLAEMADASPDVPSPQSALAAAELSLLRDSTESVRIPNSKHSL